MPDVSSLASITTAATALSNLILVNPQKTIGYQPQNAPSNNGQTAQLGPSLLFHYEGEQTASLESDITDHYIENNTAIQDQIALKPVIITTHGFIGELNDIPPPALAPLLFAADKLFIMSAYTPSISVTALVAYNTAAQLYRVAQNAVNAAVSAWSSLTGSGGENVIGSNGLQNNAFNAGLGTVTNQQNKQQSYFQLFYGYWNQRTLFTVQTPWAVFQDMAIQKLRAVQDAETNVITDFEVTFKQMRFASSQSFSGIAEARAFFQQAGVTNRGTITPEATSTTPTGSATALTGG